MRRNNKISRGKKLFQPPGTLVFIGEKKLDSCEINYITYDEEKSFTKKLHSFTDLKNVKETYKTVWLSVKGLHDIDNIDLIGKEYNIHPLVMEDIVNTGQRAKIEYYDNYLFCVVKPMEFENKSTKIKSYENKLGENKSSIIITEQISFLLMRDTLISFQENHTFNFDDIVLSINARKGRIAKNGADYLFYSLLDNLIDHYFVILEKLSDDFEIIEDEIITKPTPEALKKIHLIKNNLITFRRAVWPLREFIRTLEHEDFNAINESTRIYFKDLYDHTVQIMETVETLRDVLSNLQDLYLSSQSSKMNEIMKVLTVISTIFIPLTFIAGVYGMNFKFMPELDFHYGYPLVMLIMLITGACMIYYFKMKKWF